MRANLDFLQIYLVICLRDLSKVPILHAEDSALNSAVLLLFFFQNFHKNRYFCSKTRKFKRLNFICWQHGEIFWVFLCGAELCRIGLLLLFFILQNWYFAQRQGFISDNLPGLLIPGTRNNFARFVKLKPGNAMAR